MCRVLIVDDDPSFGHDLADRLKKADRLSFDVYYITNAAKAIDIVSSATKPFDVFLVDQALDAGSDGIELIQNLLRIMPEADAIIFTSFDDPHSGLHAYQAGAYRYLAKPFDAQELIWELNALYEYRRVQKELDWLHVLNQITEATQVVLSYPQAAMQITIGGRHLGFQRVRLWEQVEDGEFLRGLYQNGNGGLEDFESIKIPLLASPYWLKVLEGRKPRIFQGLELGPDILTTKFSDVGYQPPIGDWAIVPLWDGGQLMGMLTLDNHIEKMSLRTKETWQLLNLFGKHASAALKRARLFESEKRKGKEMKILNQIGQNIAARAALDDLEHLLLQVWEQIGHLMNVQNFKVVLVDEETGHLITQLRFDRGKRMPIELRAPEKGLIGHLIAQNARLFLPTGTQKYRKQFNIPLIGRPAKSWIGVSLQIEGRAIGAFIMQNNDQYKAYTENDFSLLCAVADQIAGVIYSASMKERESTAKSQLAILNRASEEIMKLAEQREEWVWHAVMTAATADYGLRFNRAITFMFDKSCSQLFGYVGIGHVEEAKARKDWEVDKAEAMDFSGYLKALENGRVRVTPIQEIIKGITFTLNGKADVFQEIVLKRKRLIVSRDQAKNKLPSEFIKHFGVAEYAILPIRVGEKIIGVTVVDNIFTQEPIRENALDYFEPLIAQAALVSKSLQERRVRDDLLALNYKIMTKSTKTTNEAQTLKESLEEICKAAQILTEADRVVIVPLNNNQSSSYFDLENLSWIKKDAGVVDPQPPRANGLTISVLKNKEPVVINNYQELERYYTKNLSAGVIPLKDRLYSFIATPIINVSTNKHLGVLFVEYENPNEFTQREIAHAKLFGGLAALAIADYRSIQAVRLDFEDKIQIGRKELEILSHVLEEALRIDQDKRQVIKLFIQAAQNLIRLPDIYISLFLIKWVIAKHKEKTSREVRQQFRLDANGLFSEKMSEEIFRGLAGEVLRTGRPIMADDVAKKPWHDKFFSYQKGIKSQLSVPIKSGDKTVGVLNIEAKQLAAFDKNDFHTIQRLAYIAGLIFNRINQQEQLQAVLSATQSVTAPTSLEETLASIAKEVRNTALNLSALTIWYRLPNSDNIKQGPSFGVKHCNEMALEIPANSNSVVYHVMRSNGPVWAPDVTQSPVLAGKFIKREKIKSVAAFPLRSDDEDVGAMFLNYRQRHEFTDQEKTLFAVLAEVVTASVRDAIHLEVAQRERRRLKAALDIADAAGSSLDLDETARQVEIELKVLFPDSVFAVLTYNDARRELAFTSNSFPSYLAHCTEDYTNSLPIDGPGLVCAAARKSLESRRIEYLNVGNVEHHPDYLNWIRHTRSQLSVTLVNEEKLLGVIVLESPTEDAYKDFNDIDFIRSIAHQISVAIDRANKNNELRFKTVVVAKTAWAAEIAHEVNREIGSIRNRTSWLIEEFERSLKYRNLIQEKEWINEIDQSARRLATGTKNIEQWDSSSTQSITLDQKLKKWFSEIVEKQKRNPRVDINFDLNCKNIKVRLGQVAMKRVMGHLVTNALDRTTGATQLTLQTRQLNQNWIEVRVMDNGRGIPPELYQTMFQEPKSTKVGENRGFGLLFARSAIENIGGKIWASPPEPNTGAMICFMLPIASTN